MELQKRAAIHILIYLGISLLIATIGFSENLPALELIGVILSLILILFLIVSLSDLINYGHQIVPRVRHALNPRRLF